jgi:hypothetical protein
LIRSAFCSGFLLIGCFPNLRGIPDFLTNCQKEFGGDSIQGLHLAVECIAYDQKMFRKSRLDDFGILVFYVGDCTVADPGRSEPSRNRSLLQRELATI